MCAQFLPSAIMECFWIAAAVSLLSSVASSEAGAGWTAVNADGPATWNGNRNYFPLCLFSLSHLVTGQQFEVKNLDFIQIQKIEIEQR